jgi:hypothetical protein
MCRQFQARRRFAASVTTALDFATRGSWAVFRSGADLPQRGCLGIAMSGTGGALGFRTLLVDALESMLDLFAMKGLIFLEWIFNDVLTKLV